MTPFSGRRPRRRCTPGRGTAAALAVFGLTALAACSSSGTTAPSSPESSLPAVGSTADKATTQQIGHAFEVVFGSNYTPEQSVALLQNGTVFASTLEAQSKTPRAQAASTKVIAVRLQNPNLAAVTFSISVNGTVLLPSGHGYAIREDGTWKVAAQSLCGLLALEGTPPKPCSDKSVTALPH